MRVGCVVLDADVAQHFLNILYVRSVVKQSVANVCLIVGDTRGSDLEPDSS